MNEKEKITTKKKEKENKKKKNRDEKRKKTIHTLAAGDCAPVVLSSGYLLIDDFGWNFLCKDRREKEKKETERTKHN